MVCKKRQFLYASKAPGVQQFEPYSTLSTGELQHAEHRRGLLLEATHPGLPLLFLLQLSLLILPEVPPHHDEGSPLHFPIKVVRDP